MLLLKGFPKTKNISEGTKKKHRWLGKNRAAFDSRNNSIPVRRTNLKEAYLFYEHVRLRHDLLNAAQIVGHDFLPLLPYSVGIE